MVSLFCFFWVTIIFFEESYRFPFIGTDYDLSLFSLFCPSSVVCQQIDVILRIAYSHRTGFRFYPRIGCDSQGRFRLSEAFHQFNAGNAIKFLIDFRVQSLSRNRTIFKGRNIEFAQIFSY